MTLNEDGTISGAATEAGTYTFQVVASEDTNARYPYKDVTKYYKLTVYDKNAIPDEIIYEDINLGTIPRGIEFSKDIASAVVFDDSGKLATDITYSLAEGSELPAGLELKDGVISGTTTANAGTYFFTVEASKEGMETAVLDFIVNVNAYSIDYEAQTLEDMVIGNKVRVSVATATSPDGIDIKYSMKEGSVLPEGLSLDEYGNIYGTPTKAYSDYAFTVVAKGDLAPNEEATYKINVLGVVFEDVTYKDLIIGKDYQFKLNAFANNGSTSEIYYELKEGSSLPEGFSLLADGTLIGSGQNWGAQSFTVVAKSEGNETAEATITLDFYTIFEQTVDGEPSQPIKIESMNNSFNLWASDDLVLILPVVGLAVVLLFVFMARKSKNNNKNNNKNNSKNKSKSIRLR